MLTSQDKIQLQEKGITEEQLLGQLKSFETGFPYLKLQGAAAIGEDIMAPASHDVDNYLQAWEEYKRQGHVITKFVPASGAASRMFKDMFEFLDAPYEEPTTPFEKAYFKDIHSFAFFQDLDYACRKNEGKGVDQLIADGQYKAVVANMLKDKGLNYGQLPKGLLKFHTYPNGARTPLEEHLVEAALYASSQGETEVHFTVSTEHKALFEKLVERVLPIYQDEYSINYNVSFSEQKPSTDTVAANADNTPFRTDDGKLLFRPGGHGALIQNLNDLQSDVVFVKNIDNVVPDSLKADTVLWKQVIAGVLVDVQRQAFSYLRLLDSSEYNRSDLEDMIRFVRHQLHCNVPGLKELSDDDLRDFLRTKLNRPIRVCGVVKNVGEPGGGPFMAFNPDGSVSLQILESSQIDKNNPEYMKMFTEGTHFNPVDLVCALKDYNGNRFDLLKFVDPATGFISNKSKNGRELKALELPGLWNGAMSDWSTIFVEVPLSTFNPVKTVNDLLREQHQ